MRYIKNNNFKIKMYNNINVLIKKDTNDDIIILSESAKLLLSYLDKAKTKNELLQILISRYEVEKQQADLDLEAFIFEMKKEQIIHEI